MEPAAVQLGSHRPTRQLPPVLLLAREVEAIQLWDGTHFKTMADVQTEKEDQSDLDVYTQ